MIKLKPCPFRCGFDPACADPSNKDATCQCPACGTWATVSVWQDRQCEDDLKAKNSVLAAELEELRQFRNKHHVEINGFKHEIWEREKRIQALKDIMADCSLDIRRVAAGFNKPPVPNPIERLMELADRIERAIQTPKRGFADWSFKSLHDWHKKKGQL